MKFNFNIVGRWNELYAYRDEPEQLHELANLLWRGMLWVLALIVVCSVGYAMWQLEAVLSPASVSTDTTQNASPDILNRAQLQATLNAFVTRQHEYESQKTRPPSVGSPQ